MSRGARARGHQGGVELQSQRWWWDPADRGAEGPMPDGLPSQEEAVTATSISLAGCVRPGVS